jgi:vacuolar-type H+-ATPase subunit H
MSNQNPFTQVAQAEEKAQQAIEAFKKKLRTSTEKEREKLQKKHEEKMEEMRNEKREALKAEKTALKGALTKASDDKQAACEKLKDNASSNMKDAAAIIVDTFFSLTK